MERGTVSMRVAFVLRSVEVQPLFRDLLVAHASEANIHLPLVLLSHSLSPTAQYHNAKIAPWNPCETHWSSKTLVSQHTAWQYLSCVLKKLHIPQHFSFTSKEADLNQKIVTSGLFFVFEICTWIRPPSSLTITLLFLPLTASTNKLPTTNIDGGNIRVVLSTYSPQLTAS